MRGSSLNSEGRQAQPGGRESGDNPEREDCNSFVIRSNSDRVSHMGSSSTECGAVVGLTRKDLRKTTNESLSSSFIHMHHSLKENEGGQHPSSLSLTSIFSHPSAIHPIVFVFYIPTASHTGKTPEYITPHFTVFNFVIHVNPVYDNLIKTREAL
jgi:hypothetical protein